ncbi:dihydrolipoyl dehydrogenase [Roseateles oligotrophus]|uniref:Dihydrolipoyl dehydrogenase n=1 Tax=Roseateles oligotrophus TaxID=1769250 RepID=A0ABT2YH65_9BURK|nr:dihydrolipoyl dehydrogenase [Roseateles oligotrophus]MCV2369357.1 dihydrolipoyl dehydrogenase [Roseateles oligotrophus]
MKTIQTDVAIIGAGSAGMAAYRAALAHTDRVTLIESQAYGTTCARVGCMPSKLLIAAAESAHAVKHSGQFGVHAGKVNIDGAEVMARVISERDRFVGFVLDTVEQWPPENRLWGHARFVEDMALHVGGHTRVDASRIVIATGSRPAVPEAWRRELGDRLIVNDDVFAWSTLPTSVAVVGTGVIGLELAQALHRLGVRVRLFGRTERVGPLSDPLLQSVTRDVFQKELAMSLSAQDIRPRRNEQGVSLQWIASDGVRHEEEFDYLLAAMGRRPNIDNLGLSMTRLELAANGVPVFDRRSGQVGNSPVFIAGDALDDRGLLHEAADEGRIAGDNAGRFPDVRLRLRRAPLAVVFSEPQIMLAGASHAELTRDGQAFETGVVSFEDQGRSRVMGRNQGALHVYGEPGTGRFLGAEMIGPAAEHLGHLLAWSAQRGDTVQQMIDSPFYHPVIEEGLRTALRHLRSKLQLAPSAIDQCIDCLPGT